MNPNDLQGLMALMTMMGQNQGNTIEAMMQPRGKIAQSPMNNGFGTRGAGGIQAQYDWEAQKRGYQTGAMEDKIKQERLRQEYGKLTGQQGGFGGFLQNLFGGQQPQQTAPTNSVPFNVNGGKPGVDTRGQNEVTYDSRRGVTPGSLNPATGLPFGAPPRKSEMNAAAKSGLNTRNSQAVRQLQQAQSNSQRRQQLKKTGQRTITYNPNQPTAFTGTQGAPKAQRVPVNPAARPVGNTAPQAPMPAQADGQNPDVGALFNLFSQLPTLLGMGAQQAPVQQPIQNIFDLTQPIAPVVGGAGAPGASYMPGTDQWIWEQFKSMFPIGNPNYRQQLPR